MIRIALLSMAALLVFSACERKEETPAVESTPLKTEDAPASLSRQTTPTPVAPTPLEAPAADIDPAQLQFPTQEEVSLEEGQRVYQNNCASCHERGIAGAPTLGNREQWAKRLERDYGWLVTVSIHGFKGETGVMPPRGGNPDLSNAEVAAAVAYMMDKSR